MIHEKENREDLELHLKQNGKKFSEQCVTLMREMYKGRKLNGPIVEQEFKMNSRRLRNCIEGRPDIVKRAWRKDLQNNTVVMDYWIDVPPSPTKAAAIAIGQKILDQINARANGIQQDLFTNQ